MIHIIYIYFIVNAFLAGMAKGDDKDLDTVISLSVLGILILLCAVVKWIDRKLAIWAFLSFIFTNTFKNLDDYKIITLRSMYISKYRSKAEKAVIRMIDKKYNYGITKEVQDD